MRQLSELCDALIDDRYRDTPAEIRSRAGGRLQEELRIIDKLGLPGFFLLHHDMLELAREVAVEVRGPGSARALLPPGRGRGSSVSSIVCFLTGLSHVDPIANELLIGRFLNEELTSLPDIDLDFPRDIREKLIPRVHERYGHDRSALVAAFPTFRARGAIRELGKVLGLPAGEIERVARGSEGWSARDVGADIVGAGRPELTGRWAWLARLAEQAHGLPRHLSQHSGGMIVATRPLIDCCPIVPAAMEGRQIAMWDKDSCADAGFLKIDLLGLGMLSAVERAVAMISELRGERIDLSRIPYDDPATYAMIQDADTTGVFQIESRAQMASLRRTRPETLQDITIQVAIVRPGPIQGGAVNPYIARKQRLREDPGYQIPYEHPVLAEVLDDTLGTIIFQDQVLEVSIAFAGFTIGEAEGLRRAMSRKRSDAAIEAYHERFVAGAARKHGADAETAERVFEMVKGFSGFGFPKAHGAAFGLLAYQSTWLRVHYAPEFLCALLNEQPMGFYPPDALVHEAQRGGMEVLAPDVNESGVECDVVLEPSPRVRIGLGYVRGARREELEQLVDARERGGRFRSLSDLASRAGSGADALSLLAWSGACDALALAGAGVVAAGADAAGGVAGPGPAEADEGGLVKKERIDALFAHPGIAAGTGGVLANKSHIRQQIGHTPAVSDSRHEVAAPAAPVATHTASRDRGSARRTALWQLGVMTPGRRVPGGTQLALPLDLPAPPSLQQLSEWERMLADYDTIGLTTRTHPMALLRERLGPNVVSSADLERLEHRRRVRIGGLVVARQRPGTASGVVFILLEDEFGTINLVVPPPVYERHRLTVRTEPLMLVEGRLEKLPAAGGAINVLVDTVGSIDAPDRVLAEIKDFSMLDEQVRRGLAEQKAAAAAGNGRAEGAPADGVAEDFRAVAPPVMSFASGRRR